MDEELDPDTLLRAYAMGIFPMADGRDDPEIHWIDPRRRGILPLDGFHMSRSLSRRVRSGSYRVTADAAFDAVVAACADRSETWISHRIQRLYLQLHQQGQAHSIEVWDKDRLAGGVYGVTLGAAFFGAAFFTPISYSSPLVPFAILQMRPDALSDDGKIFSKSTLLSNL